MRILLSDGAGLTARQCATVLARSGHRVEALSPEPWCLSRFTGHVRGVQQSDPVAEHLCRHRHPVQDHQRWCGDPEIG